MLSIYTQKVFLKCSTKEGKEKPQKKKPERKKGQKSKKQILTFHKRGVFISYTSLLVMSY